MVKLLLIGAVVVLVLVLLLGLAVVVVVGQAITALDSAMQQWLENRRLARIEKARRHRTDGPALLARVPAAAARRLGRGRSQAGAPSQDEAARPQHVAATPKPEAVRLTVKYNSGLVTVRPRYEFQLVCACPHCGSVDTHDLRAPVRPALVEDSVPPQPAGEPAGNEEQPWWRAVVDWFSDDTESVPEVSGPSAVEEPDADHPEIGVVRTCRSCGHAWGQQ